jgi:HSP20 family protein
MTSTNLPAFFRARFGPWRNWPTNSLRSMEQDMDRFFEGFPWHVPDDFRNGFAPSCEAEETEKEYVFKFDIPGMKRDDLKIELEDNRLTVSGERKEEKTEKRGKGSFSEIFYGNFTRSFALPSPVDEEHTSADYTDGVLTVRAKKSGEQKRREISVR